MKSKKNDGFCNEKNKFSRCLNCHIRFSAFCGVLNDQEIFELERLSFTRELKKNKHFFFKEIKPYPTLMFEQDRSKFIKQIRMEMNKL